MIFGGLVIAGCIYVFSKDKHRKQQEKIKELAQKLEISPSRHTIEDYSMKQQIADILSPFIRDNNGKNQPFQQIEKKKEEKEIEQKLRISTAMLGLAIAGLFFSPLQVIAFGGIFWISLPLYKASYQSLVKERKVDTIVVETIALTGILATGYLVLCAIGEISYYASLKLLLKTENRSVNKLVDLYKEQPKFVWLVKGDIEIKIPFEQLQKGNVISINAGEMIPIDGHVVHGHALIDEQALTGESQPAEKEIGMSCFASTLILEGRIHIKVEKTGEETTAAQIGVILEKTIDFKDLMVSKGKGTGDKAALPLLGLSAAVVPFGGLEVGAAIINTSFGFILELVSPIMVLNFLTIASEEGILIKDGRSLELLSKVDAVVFDKTGTLTTSRPHIGKIHTLNEYSEHELLIYAAAAEYRQTHPIALAILEEAKNRQLDLPVNEDTKYEIGYGVKVLLNHKVVQVGSPKFMKMEGIDIPNAIITRVEEAQQKGYSFVYVAIDQQLQGVIELRPTIRPEAKAIIQELQAKNKTCYIISGDNEQPTRYLAEQLGIQHYFSEVLPKDKADFIGNLQKQNKTVCFIGDGINDAIALKKADVSISIQGASSIAMDTAQIILLSENLKQIPFLFTLGQQFDQHMDINLKTAIIPTLIAIGGILFLPFGMTIAVAANSLSFILGIGNAIHPMVTYQYAKKELLKPENGKIKLLETSEEQKKNNLDESKL